jgi:hypothetical protein
MRAVSLPRFLPGDLAAQAAAFALMLALVWIALLVFGVTGVAAAELGPANDAIRPFRW